MAKSNSNSSIESLVGALLASHVTTLLRDLVVGPSRPISEFDLDGSSIFVVYGVGGTPLGYGGSGAGSSAASRNQTRRLVQQLASTGMVTSFRSVTIPSEDLLGVLARMIGGLLGDGVARIGDGLGQAAGDAGVPTAPRRGRPAGRPAGSTTDGRKGRPGRPRKAAAAAEAGAGESATEAPRRRGRQPGSKNKPTATGTKRGPGRPRNARAAAPEATERRRPGRPKKTEAAADTNTPAVGRKRGRPAKNAESGTPTVARRRGRPPGSGSKGARKGGRKSGPSPETPADNG